MNKNLWINIVKEPLEKTIDLAKLFCTLHLTNTYLFTPAYVIGPSMMPEYDFNGEVLTKHSDWRDLQFVICASSASNLI
uniref:Uncharacterized protein n=1 Tax=Daucus carota subsp. sativus TaxID=79200 RepID=A0A166CRY1_DAUCS